VSDEVIDQVLENVRDKISKNEPLTTVEQVVVREYVTRCRAQVSSLELKSRNIPLSEPECMRLAHYMKEITKFGGYDGIS
jgi:hypothetical protein